MFVPFFLVTLAPRQEGTSLALTSCSTRRVPLDCPFIYGLGLRRCTQASSSSRSLGSPCGGISGWGHRLSGSGLGSCSSLGSPCSDVPGWGAGSRGAGSRAQAQQLWCLSVTAPRSVGSSWTWDRNCSQHLQADLFTSCMTCGILASYQGSNPCPLHWSAES